MATMKSTAVAGLKNVYAFGAGSAEGKGDQKNLLGGKGANLAEMARLGLPVPPGFTITTEVCTHYYANKRSYPSGLQEEVAESLEAIEKALGAEVRRPEEPPDGLRPLGSAGLDAGDDGHDPEPRAERPDGRRFGASLRQPPLRLGLLPPFRGHVRGRRPGPQAP